MDGLRARGDWLGASCVAAYRRAGFLFAAALDGPVLELSGIGGKVEQGESFGAAARREFLEETGVAVDLVPVGTGRLLGSPAEPVPVPHGAAALIATRPELHPLAGTLWIAVFLARVAAAPRPVERVPYFAVIQPDEPEIRADTVSIVDGDSLSPVPAIFPEVTAVQTKDTARWVLAEPGLLAEWWALLDTRTRRSAPTGGAAQP